MSTDRRRHAPTSRVRTWLLPSLLAGIVAAAGCHDLELSQLRCSLARTLSVGYACGADGFCRRQSDSGRVAGPPGSKKQGEACASADECITHACTDGVCCDTACGDACHACNLPDNVGTCVAVARGSAPVHGACADAIAAELRHQRALRRRRALRSVRRHHRLRRRILRQGQQHVRPRSPLRRLRGLRGRGRGAVVRALHVSARRQGLRRSLRRPRRSASQPNACGGGSCGPDRQRPPLPRRQPVPVRLLRRRRLLQRALHASSAWPAI